LRIRPEPTGVKHISGVPLLGTLLALTKNIRPDWKGLPGRNTLADKENPQITTVKSFIILVPGEATHGRSN